MLLQEIFSVFVLCALNITSENFSEEKVFNRCDDSFIMCVFVLMFSMIGKSFSV